MTKRLRVGVIFGGKSAEHEVSLNSAQNVMRALDKNKYEVVPIGISKEGQWLLRGDPLQALTGGQTSLPKLLESGYQIVDDLSTGREVIPGSHAASLPDVDVIFPVLHGPFGEDGTVQGLLELADIPYVGAGVMSSAVGMDKAAMKDLFRSHDLPVAQVSGVQAARVGAHTRSGRGGRGARDRLSVLCEAGQHGIECGRDTKRITRPNWLTP